MSTLENAVTSSITVLYTAAMLLARLSLSVYVYLHLTFPQITRWLTLMITFYIAYKLAKSLASWWISSILLVIRSIMITIAVLCIIYIYGRGVQSFLNTDWPRIQFLARFLYKSALSKQTKGIESESFLPNSGIGNQFYSTSDYGFRGLVDFILDGLNSLDIIEESIHGSLESVLRRFENQGVYA